MLMGMQVARQRTEMHYWETALIELEVDFTGLFSPNTHIHIFHFRCTSRAAGSYDPSTKTDLGINEFLWAKQEMIRKNKTSFMNLDFHLKRACGFLYFDLLLMLQQRKRQHMCQVVLPIRS
jgi:hypothetical protein